MDVISQRDFKKREKQHLLAIQRQDAHRVAAKAAKSEAAAALLAHMTTHNRSCIPVDTTEGVQFLRRKKTVARHPITQAIVEQAILSMTAADGHAVLKACASNKGKRRRLEQGEWETDEEFAQRGREERSLSLAELLARMVRAKVDAVVVFERANLQMNFSKPRQFDVETERMTDDEHALFLAWQNAAADETDSTEVYTEDLEMLKAELADLNAQVGDVVDAAGLGEHEVRSFRVVEADAIVTLSRKVKSRGPKPLGITACYDMVLEPLAQSLPADEMVDAYTENWIADWAAQFEAFCPAVFLRAWADCVVYSFQQRQQTREEYSEVDAAIHYEPQPDDGVGEE
jgi:hypothetical protein